MDELSPKDIILIAATGVWPGLVKMEGSPDRFAEDMSAEVARRIKSRIKGSTILFYSAYGSRRDFGSLKLEPALDAEGFEYKVVSTSLGSSAGECREAKISPEELGQYGAENILICHKRMIPEDLITDFNLCLRAPGVKKVYLAVPMDPEGAANFCYFRACDEPKTLDSFLKEAGPKTYESLNGFLDRLPSMEQEYLFDIFGFALRMDELLQKFRSREFHNQKP